MPRCLTALLPLLLIALLLPETAQAQIWTPDPAKAAWGEDEIYAAYDRWIRQLPENKLQEADARMKEIARRNPRGTMAGMVKAQIWDCSSTAVYLWVRFLYEQRLPMVMPIFHAAREGRPAGTVTYTHAFSTYDSIENREDRFLHFAKLLQNLTYVHDLSSDLTYPIKLSALQGGVVNLSKTHTRVIAGVDRDPAKNPLMVTGQWIYTSRWAASTAFAQLEPFQEARGELGLRLWRVTVRDGDGYRLLPARDHKRHGGLQQHRAGDGNFRASVFEAVGVPYRDSLLLTHADTIFREWLEYRNLYIRTHPYPQYSHEHATTQANDQRIVTLYHEMLEVERRPDVIADLGHDYLSRKTFPIEFTNFDGWEATGEVSIRFFGDTFALFQERLSDPTEPVARRILTVQDFLTQASSHGSATQMPDFVALLRGSGEKINLRENRTWIRRMSPEAQMELMPYLEF
jgi:hypothetical protein